MIPLHRPLSPDHQTYLLALVEWDRALDLAAACIADSTDPRDELSVGQMLLPTLVAVAEAGKRLSLEDRRSIAAAMSAAATRVPPSVAPSSDRFSPLAA